MLREGRVGLMQIGLGNILREAQVEGVVVGIDDLVGDGRDGFGGVDPASHVR